MNPTILISTMRVAVPWGRESLLEHRRAMFMIRGAGESDIVVQSRFWGIGMTSTAVHPACWNFAIRRDARGNEY